VTPLFKEGWGNDRLDPYEIIRPMEAGANDLLTHTLHLFPAQMRAVIYLLNPSKADSLEADELSFRRIFAGVPLQERCERLVIILQAYIDDSGSDPQDEQFALAGLVAPLERWESFKFPDCWQAICDEQGASNTTRRTTLSD
jgi:hypothetical protein